MKASDRIQERLDDLSRLPGASPAKPSWVQANKPHADGAADQSCGGDSDEIEEQLAAQLVVTCEIGMGGTQ